MKRKTHTEDSGDKLFKVLTLSGIFSIICYIAIL